MYRTEFSADAATRSEVIRSGNSKGSAREDTENKPVQVVGKSSGFEISNSMIDFEDLVLATAFAAPINVQNGNALEAMPQTTNATQKKEARSHLVSKRLKRRVA